MSCFRGFNPLNQWGPRFPIRILPGGKIGNDLSENIWPKALLPIRTIPDSGYAGRKVKPLSLWDGPTSQQTMSAKWENQMLPMGYPQVPLTSSLPPAGTSHFPSESDQMEDLSTGTPNSFYICVAHLRQAEPVAISVKITSHLLIFNWRETTQKLTKAFIHQMV